jgi:hypothetical protein
VTLLVQYQHAIRTLQRQVINKFESRDWWILPKSLLFVIHHWRFCTSRKSDCFSLNGLIFYTLLNNLYYSLWSDTCDKNLEWHLLKWRCISPTTCQKQILSRPGKFIPIKWNHTANLV